MVKLKVIARVIPEDVYLTNIESTVPQNTPIRSERRFPVIVRDPETWFIGTLALEIKKRYASLYKHDLGQIKYLKDNTDDCDLDPELYVADVLVDEGKALIDPSDQLVTVKVIQEQGRALRQDSVVPDLSQVHYRIPERPPKPPVPRFEDVASSLGKRKTFDDNEPKVAENKRSRLDQIEDEEFIATSVEREQPLHSGVMPSSPLAAKQQNVTIPTSPEMSWSFSQVGPPTLKPKERPGVANRTDELPSASQENGDVVTADNTQMKPREDITPKPRLRGLKSPAINGNQTISPHTATGSASRKFIKPRRDVYAEPESEIDDSQMSPASKDTSRITPRLVSSNRYGQTNGKRSKVSSHETSPLAEQRLGENSEKAMAVGTGSSEAARSESSRLSGEGTEVSEEEYIEPQTASIADEENRPDAAKSVLAINGAAPSPTHTLSNAAIASNGVAVQPDLQTKESQILASHTLASPPQPLRKRLLSTLEDDRYPQKIDDSGSDIASRSSKQSDSSGLKQRKRRSRGLGKLGTAQIKQVGTCAELSTPSRDSPSEQLAKALQESTHKTASSASRKVTKATLTNLKPAIDTTQTVTRSTTKQSNQSTTADTDHDVTDEESGDDISLQASISTKAPNQPAEALVGSNTAAEQSPRASTAPTSHPSAQLVSTTKADTNALAIPVTVQTVRESSADTQITSSSKHAVLPLGLTQEQFDRMLKQNAHLNEPGAKIPDKWKRASDLRQTPSVEPHAKKVEISAMKRDAATKSAAPRVALANQKKTETAATSPTDSESEDATSTTSTETVEAQAEEEKEPSKKILVNIPPRDDIKHATPASKTAIKKPTSTTSKAQTSSLKSSESAISEPSKPDSTNATNSSQVTRSQSISEPKTINNRKQPTPTLSTVSKITSSTTAAKNAAKTSPLNAPKSMPPPTSSSTTKPAATPTPKPKPTPISAPSSTKPTLLPRPNTLRPTLTPSYSSAKTLTELRAIINSTDNSTAGSPAPTKSRFAPSKKSILEEDDDDSDSSSETESECENESDSDGNGDSKTQPKTPSTNPTTAEKEISTRGRPDPTIRDVSDDGDSDSDSDSNTDGDGGSGGESKSED